MINHSHLNLCIRASHNSFHWLHVDYALSCVLPQTPAVTGRKAKAVFSHLSLLGGFESMKAGGVEMSNSCSYNNLITLTHTFTHKY